MKVSLLVLFLASLAAGIIYFVGEREGLGHVSDASPTAPGKVDVAKPVAQPTAVDDAKPVGTSERARSGTEESRATEESVLGVEMQLSSAPTPEGEELRKALRAAKSYREQRDLLDAYVASFSPAEAREQIGQWLPEIDSPRSVFTASRLFKKWAEEEPLEATLTALVEGESRGGKSNAKTVLAAGAFRLLGLQNPEQAIGLLLDETHREILRDSLAIRTESHNISTDLAASGDWIGIQQWIQGLNELPSDREGVTNRVNFHSGLGLGLAQQDRETANRVLLGLKDPRLQVDAMAAYGYAVANESPQSALDWFSSLEALGSNDKSKILARTVEGWASHEGGLEDGLAYLSSMADEIDVDPSLYSLFRSAPMEEYETRINLFESIGDQILRDEAAAVFVRDSWQLDSQRRYEIALSIEAAGVREKTAVALYMNLSQNDASGAARMLEQLGQDDPKLRDRIVSASERLQVREVPPRATR